MKKLYSHQLATVLSLGTMPTVVTFAIVEFKPTTIIAPKQHSSPNPHTSGLVCVEIV